MYISLFGCQNLGAHACKPVWISFWIRHWALLSILSKIRYLICHSNLNWLLNLSLIYKTLAWDRKWFIDFNAENMDGSVFEGKLSFKILGWLSLLNSIGELTLFLLLKLSPRKLEPFLWTSVKFLSPRLLCISINLPFSHVWNTVVTSGLVPLLATWNC